MRIHKIRAAVQVAVDWSFGLVPPQAALVALDKACSHSELSGIAPIASAIRLLVFYADVGNRAVDHDGQAARLLDLQNGVKGLAGIILGHVAPSPVTEDNMPKRDVKMLAAGDTND